MHPFIAGLDASRAPVAPHEVLEATEADDRLTGICFFELQTFSGDELPSLEVHMTHEVIMPGSLDSGLEGEYEHALCIHVFCELVSCKRLAEAHLCVPEEPRSAARMLVLD